MNNEPLNTIEQAEVILSNLLALSDTERDCFVISHLDIELTLKTAVRLLQEAQDDAAVKQQRFGSESALVRIK